jgi:exopolysaccharide biosynthesis polyprenyl glycosylphosphotransferase
MPLSLGYIIAGFISLPEEKQPQVPERLILGNLSDLDAIVDEKHIEEIIIALDKDNDEQLERFYSLYKYDLPVKVVADRQDILMGKVKMSTVYGKPMYELFMSRLNYIDENIKRVCDKLVAFLILLFLSPLFLFFMLRIKMNDRQAPVFFRQERIGKKGKPFIMYKFRTMEKNAEKDGPMLSNEDDPRITPVGKWMRKYRLDELPQFWNVFNGNMSIVGPRPERQYFVEKIVEKAPFFYLLFRVKPGITSWGMVKYGYAQSVDEMIERLNYDIIYLKNMSLIIDIKILIYTVRTVITGQGI